MKLLGIVVTYFPKDDELIQNINTYIDEIDCLIIWENTPNIDILYDRNTIEKLYSGKIIFSGTGKNEGIGVALNFAAKHTLNNNFTHMLTLDQDSCFEKGMLYKYKESVRKNLTPDVGLYGTNLLYTNGRREYDTDTGIIEVKYCITSGSLIPAITFEKGCFFDENLFIDGVDLDYCFRLNKLFGLRVVVFPLVHLMHSIGYPVKTFLGFSASAYSAFRTYFVVKNQILILRRYPTYYSLKEKLDVLNNYIIKRIFTIIFYERNKKPKFLAILKGIKEGSVAKKY